MRVTRFLILLALDFVAGNAFAQAVPALPVPAGLADTIFYNGKIVTVDSSFHIDQAFAVKGDQFVAVGSNAEVRRKAGPKTPQIDLHGSTVIPGLIDDHNHQYAAAMNSRGVDVVGVSSLQEMLNRIRAAVAKAKPGEVVFTTAGYKKEEEELLLLEQQKRNAEGLTSIRDLNIYPNGMRAYYRLWLDGKMTVRVGVGLRIVESPNVGNVLSGWGMSCGFGDRWLRIDSISEDPHPNLGKEFRGTDFTQEMFDNYKEAIFMLNRYDWRFSPHLSDNPSLDLTLDAFEAADRKRSIHDKRWVAEHIPDVTSDEMDRLARLGILVSAQFQPYDSNSETSERAVPMREMLDHHLIVGAGSDTHGFGQIDNPFVPFYFYVTRKTKNGKLVGPQEKISREEALRASTVSNAYLTFEENIKGSIEPGKLADFLILNQDLITVPEDQILSTHPLATYVGGRKVYSSKVGSF